MDAKDLFTLHRPCPDCPFLKENRDMLSPGRLEDIIVKLHDNAPFHCHKTINYRKRSKKQQIAEAKYCAGSMVYLEKAGNTNVPMRLGLLFGIYDPSQLRGHEEVIEPLGLVRYVPERMKASPTADV